MADNRVVRTVRVVCHTAGRMGGNTEISDNHWSIYLIINDNESVRLNMRAEPGYITGNLEVKPHAYSLTSSQVRYWDFSTVANLTVDYILRLIYGNRRHLYNMAGGGSGCRYWVWVIVCDLARQGYLSDTNAGQTLWPNLLYRYSKNADPQALPMVQGEFVNA